MLILSLGQPTWSKTKRKDKTKIQERKEVELGSNVYTASR
jgi:hypothetical protein